jgi:hypothetical protein
MSQHTPGMTFAQAIDIWLAEPVNFGGNWVSRAEVYAWFERAGWPRRAAELWLIGYERTKAEGRDATPQGVETND